MITEKHKRNNQFLFGILLISLLFITTVTAHAAPIYGQESSEIGTFQTPTGNWVTWIGWDATFSDTYAPENETYNWMVFFAPEGVYVALASSKGIYSAVNVYAGFDYYYGSLNLAETTLTKEAFSNDLDSITISKNTFDASVSPGSGPFASLGFSANSALTFLKEKASGHLQRGVQLSAGISLALDLISLPLPLSVSIGIPVEAGDPPELGKFYGFYPVLLWDTPIGSGSNPMDLVAEKLQNDSTAYAMLGYSNTTRELLLKAVRLIQSSQEFNEFLESTAHNSAIDEKIKNAQDWLDSENPSHLNLPSSLLPSSPSLTNNLHTIMAATQMTFETAYSRAPQDHTVYADCIKPLACTLGKKCTVTVTAEEILKQIPESSPPFSPSILEGLWVGFDTSPESYIIGNKIKWIQLSEGEAKYGFDYNAETSNVLGLFIDNEDLPTNIRALQDKNIELCRRQVGVQNSFPWTMYLPTLIIKKP